MKKIFLFLICLIGIQAMAQNKMRITMNDGSSMDFYVNGVKDMLYYTPETLNIVGEEWLFIDGSFLYCYSFQENGIFKYKSYNELNSYELEGTYSFEDNVLKTYLYGGAFLTIEIANITKSTITASSNEIYYRVQQPEYNMKSNDSPITIGEEGDIIKVTDNYITTVEDNKIKALKEGCGYAIVQNAETNEIRTYRINVEFVAPEVIDWSQYLNKTYDEIIEEFGDEDQINEEKLRIAYQDFDASIEYVTFTFTENFEKVEKINLSFYDEAKRQHYCDSIAQNYILYKEYDNGKIYIDNNDKNNASLEITVYDASTMCTIVYEKLK